MEEELFNCCTSLRSWCKTNSASPLATTHFGPMADDLMDFLFPGSAMGTWGALEPEYRSAWLGEIKRRIQLAGGYSTLPKPLQDILSPLLKKIVSTGAAMTAVGSVRFSQFSINNHFQGSYVGQPGWLANKKIVDCAKLLNTNSLLSATMRIKLHRRGTQWVTLNNRGFALHSLAEVTPMRLVFDPNLGSEEAKRFGDTRDRYTMRYGDSLPAARRDPSAWTATIPTDVTSVSGKKPFNKDDVAVPIDIEYTVEAQLTGANAGNALVRNSL